MNLIGQGSFKPLVLKRGMLATDTEFFSWLMEQMNPASPYLRRQMTIDVLDTAGDTLYTYDFEGILTRYKVLFSTPPNRVSLLRKWRSATIASNFRLYRTE